ncbi:putative acetylornithine deacetylase [Diaporthe ampelina]|uniref:Putative acetylornithine deacetylase n=1 Tax=Diaporthe ampelina TaxID=1214573 RepID=A0A0G2HN44_9PEZI|nr:putative acetylornithine deacetylase [Diaporthe ampelina]
MLCRQSLLLALSLSPAFGSVTGQQQPLGVGNQAESNPAPGKAPAYRDDLLALHKKLVDISSTTGAEHEIGAFLIDYFISQSWHYEVDKVVPRNNTPEGGDRLNVVAWPPSGSSRHHGGDKKPNPKVLVTSHIDVVPPHIPYSISDGKITRDTAIAGRGSVDAKGSVAAQLTAVEDLLARGLLEPEDVMVAYVVGEERYGDGMRAFSERAKASSLAFKAAIFGEPTENKLACGHKGGLSCEVTATGKAGHSGYPWLGKSANEVLLKGLLKLLDTDLGSSERYGNTTVNIGLLQGGIALNVIPAHASASLFCRVAIGPQESGHEAVREKLKEVLASVDDEALSVECPGGGGVVPCDCDVNGFDTIVANYGTDIPYLEGNHTRYLYGPGTILVAHGDNEALTVGNLEDAVEGFQKLILHSLKL